MLTDNHKCQNRLKQIVLGLLNHDPPFRSATRFPPAYTTDEQGNRLHSWRTLILPEIDRTRLHAEFDLQEPWNSEKNAPAAATSIDTYHCPADTRAAPMDASFVGIAGPGTAWRANHGVAVSEILDGTAKTILLIELRNSGIKWAEPRDLELDNLPSGITKQNLLQSLSNHRGGFNAAFVDGHVEFIPSSIPWADFESMVMIADGGVVDRRKW